jgi:pyrimidine-nucleoside phosphorylase
MSASFLARVRDGSASPSEVASFAMAIGRGEVPDAEVGAFLMAVRLVGIDTDSLAALTLAMAQSGKVLSWDVPTADKHSTGGVGDKTSFIVAPLLAELGLAVPMISGRSLGHTGGTLDKLEAVTGLRTELTLPQMQDALVAAGGFITAATADLAPADKVMYALRDRTATVDSIPLIASSIVSKKLASGAAAIVFDVKYGAAAFMQRRQDASLLAHTMVELCRANGVAADALLSQMDTPLGRGIGNAVEIEEALDVLAGRGDHRLRELSIELTRRAALAASIDVSAERLRSLLTEGHAHERFMRILHEQGANLPLSISKGRYTQQVRSTTGARQWWDALGVARAASLAGATRQSAGSVPDPSASITLHTPDSTWCAAASDVLATVSCNDAGRCESAALALHRALRSDEPPASLTSREVFAEYLHPQN